MNKTASVCCVSFLIAGAGVARADFGSAGTKVVVGDIDLDVGRNTTEQPDGESSSTTDLELGVTGGYFVAEHVSVGLGVTALYRSDEDASQSMVAVGVSGGYAARLGARLHVWPQLGVSVGRTKLDLGSLEGTGVAVGASAYVPFVYEPSEHLLLGLGPVMGRTLHNSATIEGETEDGPTMTTVGISAVLAGWF